MSIRGSWFFSLLLAGVVVCNTGFIAPYFDFVYPHYFPEPVYDIDQSPLTDEKILLGRVLFYDPVLSKDSSISCASCHSPYNAFAHTDHDLSHGIDDQIGKRNAPALFNLAWQRQFMWDGAISHLDFQSLAPISDPLEMGETISHVVEKLNGQPRYKQLFNRAFGEEKATGETVLKALAQFQLTLVSSGSKYDKVRRGEAEFTNQELTGYRLFQKNCNACHAEPLFSTYGFANNGLPIDDSLNDAGRKGITKQQNDDRLFKIPSLRNLSYTFPYMHDGRFRKLREVLRHYNEGVETSATLSPEMKTIEKLDARQQVDLIAFLLTLNDEKFVFEPSNKFPKSILLPTSK